MFDKIAEILYFVLLWISRLSEIPSCKIFDETLEMFTIYIYIIFMLIYIFYPS